MVGIHDDPVSLLAEAGCRFAFGMPGGRFRAVAAAAEAATGAGVLPNNAATRLREASLSAPPCTG